MKNVIAINLLFVSIRLINGWSKIRKHKAWMFSAIALFYDGKQKVLNLNIHLLNFGIDIAIGNIREGV